MLIIGFWVIRTSQPSLQNTHARRLRPVSYREHGLLVSENLLKQDFYVGGPNQKWAGDITYLRTDEGWLYLAVVIDLWSRAVIGWSMLKAQLACDALQMALGDVNPGKCHRKYGPRRAILFSGLSGITEAV